VSAPVIAGRKMAWVRDRLPLGVSELMKATRLLGTDPVPETSSNEDLIVSILDQGALGSCVGNGTVQGARGEMVRAGAVAPALGSRLWTYYIGRAFDHDTGNDDGTQIHNAFAGIAKYGLPPEAVWPYSDDSSPGAPFSQMPSPDAWRAAFDGIRTFSMHRIDSTGAARVDDVKRALGQRRLVVFGTNVSEDFCSGKVDPTVPQPPPIGKTIAGGHCRVYVSHDAAGVKVANSWGPSWGDGGYSIDSWDYVAWDQTSDLWLFDSTPKDLGGAP